ncbi:MAG: radical SAM protein [Candidatus Competibacter sp.]|nr:radical SAM protein [Candidatus Competibacter sp.]
MKKLALITPSNNYFQESIFPPLGLIALRSAIRQQLQLDVAILDGLKYSYETIKGIADEFDIIGLQVHSLNSKEAVSIGRKLRSYKRKVMIGGPEVTISRNLNWASDAFDLAVLGHISKNVIMSIDELLTNKIREPKIVIGHNQFSGRIDYSRLDLKTYWSRSQQTGREYRHAPVISHLGCTFRNHTKGGCSFCADVSNISAMRNLDDLTHEVWQLYSMYDVKSFFCVGENLAQEYMYHILKPHLFPKDISWSFFARASEITPKTVLLLKAFGVREIRLGVESGDSQILAAISKGENLNSIENAIRLLDSSGVTTTASFVLGLPGESHLSLQKTVNLAKKWSQIYSNLFVSVSIVMPIPGSRIGKLADVEAGDGVTTDHQKDFIMRFTNISWQNLMQAAEEISSLPRSVDPATTMVDAPWRRSVNETKWKTAPYVRCA